MSKLAQLASRGAALHLRHSVLLEELAFSLSLLLIFTSGTEMKSIHKSVSREVYFVENITLVLVSQYFIKKQNLIADYDPSFPIRV